MPTDLDHAWHDLHDAKPAGWYVGPPSYDEGRRVWEQYAFDPTERSRAGVRSREWTAVAPTELEVIRELAHCLRLNREGRAPGEVPAIAVRRAGRSVRRDAEPGDRW